MIEINNISKTSIDKKFFSTVAKKVLSGENRKTETLSLVFVSKEEIKNLNRKFRKKNKATDVLSFELNEKNYLGEVVICPEVVKKNVPIARRSRRSRGLARKSEQSRILDGKVPTKSRTREKVGAVGTKKAKPDFEKELAKVFVHGILHLCGYDHEESKKGAEKMEGREKVYLSKI